MYTKDDQPTLRTIHDGTEYENYKKSDNNCGIYILCVECKEFIVDVEE